MKKINYNSFTILAWQEILTELRTINSVNNNYFPKLKKTTFLDTNLFLIDQYKNDRQNGIRITFRYNHE